MTATLETPPAEAAKMTPREAERTLANMAKAVARKKTIEAEIADAALAKQREHEAELNRIEAKLKTATDTLRGYAEEHPEMFTDKRTLEMAAGTIGFRAGQPSVAFSEGWDEKRAIEAVQALKPSLREQFLRVVTSLEKRALIAYRANTDFLEKIGVVVKAEEKFFVKTNA